MLGYMEQSCVIALVKVFIVCGNFKFKYFFFSFSRFVFMYVVYYFKGKFDNLLFQNFIGFEYCCMIYYIQIIEFVIGGIYSFGSLLKNVLVLYFKI